MTNGFLDNLPDLGLKGSSLPRKKKRQKQPEKTINRQAPIIWQPVKCPECGSEKVPVHTTRKPIRYHKCDDCGCRFKSVER